MSLALLAALLFALAAAVQQYAAHRAGYSPPLGTSRQRRTRRAWLVPPLRLLGVLVRTRLWLMGWAANLAGFLVLAAALQLGSVALVQPLLVTQLIFALPMASVWSRQWPTPLAWLSAIAICAAIAIFLSVRGVAPLNGGADRPRVVLAGLSTLAAVSALVLVGAGRPPLVHATLMAVAAGLCFAMSAVMTKLTVQSLVDRGLVATAAEWVGYALAASVLAGIVLEQVAFAAGTLPAAIAAMTITNPLASYVIGSFAFHVPPVSGPEALAALAVAGALLCAGVLGLAHSPIVRGGSARTAPGGDR